VQQQIDRALTQVLNTTIMRTYHPATFHDTVQHLPREETQDRTGQPISTYGAGASFPARFLGTRGIRGAREANAAGAANIQILTMDAAVRLPLDVIGIIHADDRIRLTHRFGEALPTPLEFDVVGAPQLGSASVVLSLTEVGH
jgi:hypothetical protein